MSIINETLVITWSTEDWLDPDGNPLSIKLELSRDGGSNWETITEATTDDGSYSWVVTGPVSDDCVIRFSDPNDPSIYASGELFEIY